MRLLTAFLFAGILVAAAGCSRQAATTPERALEQTRQAWLKHDAAAFETILCTSSRSRIDGFVAVQRTLPEAKARELEEKLACRRGL
jgi:uncharacterized protein YecT (DUF1311 family)